MARSIHRSDASQSSIVEALRNAGALVWIIGRPCDLLTFYRGRWLPIEVKTLTATGKRRKRKDQAKQDEFIAKTGTPVVGTPEQALEALK